MRDLLPEHLSPMPQEQLLLISDTKLCKERLVQWPSGHVHLLR